ncbi:restriction endonuclease subunit S [Antarcticimicrobium luteum]|uniref:Restriction endonuclease subunit S n=2 Tax=Antarcticimicrobium luteum TaxID=2547397 RepID=A0A4V3ASG3_9RHOB|nr:restriction endonuclease subunit S [Antarcticimicrobium luteum]
MTMKGGLVDPATKFKKRVASEDTSAYKVVKRGQLVVGFPIDEGVLSFQQLFDEAIVSPAYGIWDVAKPEEVNPNYLERFLKSPQAITYYLGKLRSTTARRRSLDRSSFLELPVPLPPREEQKRIAGILDQADALRRLRTRALDKLNTLGPAIFHEMFGEGIANGKCWGTCSLGDLVRDDDRINYGVVQPGDHDPKGVPLIRVADLTSPVVDFTAVKRISNDIDENYARSRLQGGEILIGCVGSIGTTMVAPKDFCGANIARAVARVAIDPEKCDPEFVAEYIRSDLVQRYFQKEVRLVAQPTLNIKQIRETKIVSPPRELQESFLKRIGVLKKTREVVANDCLKQETLFASIQHRAFRGEL